MTNCQMTNVKSKRVNYVNQPEKQSCREVEGKPKNRLILKIVPLVVVEALLAWEENALKEAQDWGFLGNENMGPTLKRKLEQRAMAFETQKVEFKPDDEVRKWWLCWLKMGLSRNVLAIRSGGLSSLFLITVTMHPFCFVSLRAVWCSSAKRGMKKWTKTGIVLGESG